jgi:hypothetical protein
MFGDMAVVGRIYKFYQNANPVKTEYKPLRRLMRLLH